MASILITGANRGIGFEFSKQYLEIGNQVYACCRNLSESEKLQELQNKYPTHLSILSLNIGSEENIIAIKNNLVDRPIDIIINNAGIFTQGNDNAFLNSSLWQTFFSTNTIGPYLLTQALLDNMLLGRQKKIINISSVMGSISLNNDGGYAPYRASKAALNSLSKNLAIDLAHHSITVTALHPGWVRTDMGGPNGTLSPKESVFHLITLINNLTLEDSGKFFDWEGKELLW